jgi:hypothetical protein
MTRVGPYGEGLGTPVMHPPPPAGGWISEAAPGLPGADFFVRAEIPVQTRLPASLWEKRLIPSLRTPVRRLRHIGHSLRRVDTRVGDGLGESARLAVRRVFEDLSLAGQIYR